MASVGEKMNLDNSLLQNTHDINRAASTSFNLGKMSDLNEGYELMYPILSQPLGKSVIENEKPSTNSRRNIKTSHQYKSPYNVHNKKKGQGSSKKRSIESDSKDLSTSVPNTNQSDSRYKAQLLNAKNEKSCRLQVDSNVRESSKRSQDNTTHTMSYIRNPEDLGEVLGYKLIDSEHLRLTSGSGHPTQESLETEKSSLVYLLQKTAQQEKLLDEYKAKEVAYKDKIYELEKQLREATHKLEVNKLEHEREMSSLNRKLEK